MEEELVRDVWRHQLIEIHDRKPYLPGEMLQIVDKVGLRGDRRHVFERVTILPGVRRYDHHRHSKVILCREGSHPSKCVVQPRSIWMIHYVGFRLSGPCDVSFPK